MLPFNDTSWVKVIGENVPEKTIKINIDAFNIGRIKYENIHKNR
jgi:Pyruvate/2-oxoacid:ferredoxin oxidoreductase gamma subunit